MFQLPPETLLLLIGAPLAWVGYTLVFLFRSRRREDDGEGPGQT